MRFSPCGAGGWLLARRLRREAMVGARNASPRGDHGSSLPDLHWNHSRKGEPYRGTDAPVAFVTETERAGSSGWTVVFALGDGDVGYYPSRCGKYFQTKNLRRDRSCGTH